MKMSSLRLFTVQCSNRLLVINECKACNRLSSSCNRKFHGSSHINSQEKKNKNQEVTVKLSDADKSKDYIGPPDPVTNLRQISFRSQNQSDLEKKYHKQCENVMKFNHEFWKQHNTKFVKEKDEFVEARLKEKKDGENTLSAEEMSEFYRKFLNENFRSHVRYNLEWYKRNITLLGPAFKVSIQRLLQKVGMK